MMQKLQAPTTKLQRNFNLQISIGRVASGGRNVWGLNIGASLDVEAWNLEVLQ
jgi:hypothetical protein